MENSEKKGLITIERSVNRRSYACRDHSREITYHVGKYTWQNLVDREFPDHKERGISSRTVAEYSDSTLRWVYDDGSFEEASLPEAEAVLV